MPTLRTAALCTLASLLTITTLAADDGFVHPGLLHTRSDLERMKIAVENKQEPIYSAFLELQKSRFAQADYHRRGPCREFGRLPNICTGQAQDDGNAAYQNSLMWAITGKREHAKKAIEILDEWSARLERVIGIDGVLAAGLQGIKFVNAAEILRHTDSGWTEEAAQRCEKSFRDAWLPTIEHYAYFANCNWETAALQTKLAIAIYSSDRELFEETIRYAVAGCGNGSIPNTIVYPTGQCQETTRAQHYAQLGIGLLANATEMAWNQGVDLYGAYDNRLLAGYEYIAKYGLGEDVPYQHHLDRTGKYGLGGRHKNYDKISTVSRGSFWQIFERPYQHYTKRRAIAAPYSAQVVAKKRPEGFSNDNIGLGTLTHWRRPALEPRKPTRAPGVPSGIVARSDEGSIRLSWVRSVEPESSVDATTYTVARADSPGATFRTLAEDVSTTSYVDRTVNRGQLYRYVVTARSEVGESARSAEISSSAGLPLPFTNRDIGSVGKCGFAEYDGETFRIEAEGRDIGGEADEFHYAYAPMRGEGTITARIVLPLSSQWSKLGVMMRESLEPGSRHASVLLLPQWSGGLVARSETDGETAIDGARELGEPFVIRTRLMKPHWVRLIRFRNEFTGYISSDGDRWRRLGTKKINMSGTFYVGLAGCSKLDAVTTTVTFDRVSIPTFRMTDGERLILSRPAPRWGRWSDRFESFNARVKKGDVGMLIIGDSITHWFDTTGRPTWDKYYAPRRAVNLAISGDRTEHILWRLENGNIDGIDPKLAVLMIGTNNHLSSPPEITARDIRLIVEKIRRELPETKVLVLAIFPRGDNDSDGARQTNEKVNKLIADIGDGDQVHFLDMNQTFLNGRRLRREFMPDGTHPSAEGYAAWAEAMEPTVRKLLGE